MKIKLTQGKFTVIDDDLYKSLLEYMEEHGVGGWYAYNNHGHCFYAVAPVEKGGLLYLHRVIAEIADLPIPSSKHTQIDHRNRNGLDNMVCNLRWVTSGQNQYNTKNYNVRKTSKYRGVCRFKNCSKWVAKISFNSRKVHIGYFTDEEEAARAYDKKKIEITGEHYGLNFPQEDYCCV